MLRHFGLTHSQAFCWCLCVKLGTGQPLHQQPYPKSRGQEPGTSQVSEKFGQEGWVGGPCGQFQLPGLTGCPANFHKTAQSPGTGLQWGEEGQRRAGGWQGSWETVDEEAEGKQLTQSLLQACWLQLRGLDQEPCSLGLQSHPFICMKAAYPGGPPPSNSSYLLSPTPSPTDSTETGRCSMGL